MVNEKNIHLISFCTEGPPHDGGFSYANQYFPKVLECLKNSQRVKTINLYTPRKLIEEFGEEAKWSIKDFRGEVNRVHPANPTYHHVGMGGWRAFLLDKFYDRIEDGEVIYFQDCGKPYFYGKDGTFSKIDDNVSCLEYLWEARDLNPIFLQVHNNFTVNVKPSLYEKYNLDRSYDFCPILRGRMFVAKKDKRLSGLFKEYADVCKENNGYYLEEDEKDKELLKKYESEGFKFVRNSMDQGVFSALCYGRKFMTKENPFVKINDDKQFGDYGKPEKDITPIIRCEGFKNKILTI